MRPIDADRLKRHYAWWGSECASDELKERKKDFDDIIDVQPTIESELVRHGKWIAVSNLSYSFEDDELYKYICSECKNVLSHAKPYCPECGSKNDVIELSREEAMKHINQNVE